MSWAGIGQRGPAVSAPGGVSALAPGPLRTGAIRPGGPSGPRRRAGQGAYGPVRTDGALRCEYKDTSIVVTPLPDSEPFTVKLDLPGTAWKKVKSIIAADAEGRKIRDVDFTGRGNLVEFQARENEFAYVIRKDSK